MITVHVQIWGSLSVAPGYYDWITIGRMNNPKSLDIDYLSKRAIRMVRGSRCRPHTDVIRFQVVVDGKKEMMMTMLDFFKNQMNMN